MENIVSSRNRIREKEAQDRRNKKSLKFLSDSTNKNSNHKVANLSGVPTGIRTPVPTVKGLCPRPLDDGDLDLERETRLELATSTLARLHSTN